MIAEWMSDPILRYGLAWLVVSIALAAGLILGICRADRLYRESRERQEEMYQ